MSEHKSTFDPKHTARRTAPEKNPYVKKLKENEKAVSKKKSNAKNNREESR